MPVAHFIDLSHTVEDGMLTYPGLPNLYKVSDDLYLLCPA